MSKQFRHAYVVQSMQRDFSAIMELAESVIFMSNGTEPEKEVQYQIQACMKDFVPETDVLVPSGNAMVNVMAGMELVKYNVDLGHASLAIYQDKSYHIVEVSLDR